MGNHQQSVPFTSRFVDILPLLWFISVAIWAEILNASLSAPCAVFSGNMAT